MCLKVFLGIFFKNCSSHILTTVNLETEQLCFVYQQIVALDLLLHSFKAV